MLMAQAGKYSTQVLAIWPFNLWGWGFQHVIWMALFIGFAIKIPAFPFHTWLPDAHVEAPTAISVILAGVLLKMGTYGILRINFPMLPVATADLAFWFLGALGAWNIIYGALCAMAQKDLEEAGRLFERQPHGLRHARHGELHHPGHQRRGPADVQPRHDHRHALPLGRRDLRPRAPPRDRRLRRPGRDHAGLHRRDRARLLRVDGTCPGFPASSPKCWSCSAPGRSIRC